MPKMNDNKSVDAKRGFKRFTDTKATRSVSIKGVDEPTRKVELPFMTSARCSNGWGFDEIVLCGEQNVDKTRFENGVMPMLFNHDRDIVIGHPESVEFLGDSARAVCVFDDDADSEKYFKKVLSGSLRGISVGYRRKDGEYYRKGTMYNGEKLKEDLLVTTLWEPTEISLVSCPADPECGVGRELDDTQDKTIVDIEKGEKNMPEEAKKALEIEVEKAKKAEKAAKEEAARAVAEERARVAEIASVCRQFELPESKAEEFIKSGASIDSVRASVLEVLAQGHTPVATAAPKVEVGETHAEKMVKKAADGLALRYNIADNSQVVAGAESFRTRSLKDIAEDCLVSAGEASYEELRGLNPSDLLSRVSASRSMGSNQFTAIIDAYGNKVKMHAYNIQPYVFETLTTKGSNRDFKPTHRYQLGLDGLPREMGSESGEFFHDEMRDRKISTSIQTYGKAIKLTREIFINDDMGIVTDAIKAQVHGFRRLQEKMFFETLAKIDFKGLKLQATKHKDISVAAYSEMRSIATHAKDFEGKDFVGVAPKYLLVNDLYGFKHKELLTSTANPEAAHSGVNNPVHGIMQLVETPRIEDATYYAIADPRILPGIEFTTLNGISAPSSRTITPDTTLGVEYQLWMDFGFNVINPQAFVQNVAVVK